MEVQQEVQPLKVVQQREELLEEPQAVLPFLRLELQAQQAVVLQELGVLELAAPVEVVYPSRILTLEN